MEAGRHVIVSKIPNLPFLIPNHLAGRAFSRHTPSDAAQPPHGSYGSTMAELDVARFFSRLGKLHSHFIKHK